MADLPDDVFEELPAGAVVENSIVIVSFLNQDGEQQYAFNLTGNAHVTTLVGLLKLVEIHLLREAGLL